MSIKAVIFDFFGVISSEVSPFWFRERFSDEEAKILKDKYMTPADRGDLSEEEVFRTLSELSGESPIKIEADFASRVVIDKKNDRIDRLIARLLQDGTSFERYGDVALENTKIERS